jgi:hypothetical protein
LVFLGHIWALYLTYDFLRKRLGKNNWMMTTTVRAATTPISTVFWVLDSLEGAGVGVGLTVMTGVSVIAGVVVGVFDGEGVAVTTMIIGVGVEDGVGVEINLKTFGLT